MSRIHEGSQASPELIQAKESVQKNTMWDRFRTRIGRRSKPEVKEIENKEYLLFGPLGRDVYSPEEQQRIDQAFGSTDSKNEEARQERMNMWTNYGHLKVRTAQLLRKSSIDILSAERKAIQEVSPWVKEDNVNFEKSLSKHLIEATAFAEKFVLNPDGTSRFSLLTDRQARLLARVITPSHDLQKYMAASKGEDFTADHQKMADDFIRAIYLSNPNAQINLGTEVSPELTSLTPEEVNFVADVVGDHENVLKKEGRRNFIHSEDPTERLKALFFVIDVLTGVLEPIGEDSAFGVNADMLRTRFTDLYVRHMNLATRKVFDPKWGPYTVGDLMEIFNTLCGQGLQLPHNINQILVQAALDAFPLTHVDPGERDAVYEAKQQLETLKKDIVFQ